MHWQTTRFRLTFDRPLVMGIVNVSADSFSARSHDGGVEAAMALCDQLAGEGADILDIGGASTRPGAMALDPADELARVMPVVRHAVTLGLPVSIDTSHALVMRGALEAGVDIVNDVKALQRPGTLELMAASPQVGVCLMHMRGEPDSMQSLARYDDAVLEVRHFLQSRLDIAVAHGVALDRIALDPGVGFAKLDEHNWQLTRRLDDIVALGRPILVGWSRKSTLGRLAGRDVHHRLGASVAAALASVHRGASIVRVHDVSDTVDAIKVWQAALGLSIPQTS